MEAKSQKMSSIPSDKIANLDLQLRVKIYFRLQFKIAIKFKVPLAIFLWALEIQIAIEFKVHLSFWSSFAGFILQSITGDGKTVDKP